MLDSEIGKAIIGIAGAIIGGLVKAYGEEIWNLRWWATNHDYLRGGWTCRWDTTSPEVEAPIEDLVEVTRVRGILIKGKGSNSIYGTYYLEGKAAALAVRLSYCGEGATKDLVGVVILKRDTPTKLSGVWCQYAADGTLKGGATTWEKRFGSTGVRA